MFYKQYWRQRVKNKHLNSIDFNSSYFHKVASGRRTRKIIKTFTSASGTIFSDEDEIRKEIKTEFEDKFKQSPINITKLNKFLNLINKEVTQSDNMKLTMQVTNLEIKETVFDIGSEKSPRPDGMPSGFYQKY